MSLLARTARSPIIVSPVALDELEKNIVPHSLRRAVHRRDSGRPLVAPRTEIEKHLTKIWSQALGLAKVSIEDNWFELGGHSLLGIRILSQLREKFQIELSLNLFFESPTIAVQARTIERALANARLGDVAQLTAVDREHFRRTRQGLRKR